MIADASVEAEEAELVGQGDELMTQLTQDARGGEGGGMDLDEGGDGEVLLQSQHVSDSAVPAAAAAAVDHGDGDGGVNGVDDSLSDVEPDGVRCPCLANDNDGIMIMCAVCRYWQHAICFKIRNETSAPTQHVCNLCYSPSIQPTDPELCHVDQATAQEICLWRRSLAVCLEVTYIGAAQLANRLGVSDAIASHLVSRLESEGYATGRGASKKYIQKRKIKGEALAKYLSGGDNAFAMDVEL